MPDHRANTPGNQKVEDQRGRLRKRWVDCVEEDRNSAAISRYGKWRTTSFPAEDICQWREFVDAAVVETSFLMTIT